MLIVAVVANVTPGPRSLTGLSQTLLLEERQSSSCACDTGDRAHYNAMALPNASHAYKRVVGLVVLALQSGQET